MSFSIADILADIRNGTRGTAQPCHLLKLPDELRKRIYELALHENDPIAMRPSSWTKDGKPVIKLTQPALSATNRQIRRETLAIYYGINTFEQRFAIGGSKDASESFGAYLDALGEESCKLLRKVRVVFVFLLHPTADAILPWLRLFCRESKCMPSRGTMDLQCMFASIDGGDLENVDWVESLMEDLEVLGWSLMQADAVCMVPRSETRLEREMYHWLAGLEKPEYTTFVRQLNTQHRWEAFL